MGCVYSYPLFSFQGSNPPFSAARFILPNLFLIVKYFFKNFSIFILFLLSQQRMLSYQISFRSSSTFFCTFRLFRSPLSQQRVILYHIFFSQSSTFFRTSESYFVYRFLSATVIYYTCFSGNVNTFFHIFPYFFKIRQKALTL